MRRLYRADRERRIAIDRSETSYGVAVDAKAAEAARPPLPSSGGRAAVRCSARLNADAPGAPTTRRPASVSTSTNGTNTAAERRARAAQRALEVEDTPRVLRDKCRRLARALRNAKHLVVYTGAGISTAADIPDYRGPDGVWTRLQRGESVGRVEVSRARPTYTHMALTALWARGTLKFVASQNCDGLHLRAGMPRRALAELHGNMFAELCAPCRRLYLRAFDTTERTARHRHATRRLCHACGAELRDSIVHFGERGRAAWPLNWAGALRHAARADVVLCLGSSLKVLRRYPRLWRMRSAPSARPALYIVNLQWTPKDAVAALKINARCDAVMRQVARRLRLRVPPYHAALDPLLAHAEPLAPPEAHTSTGPLLRAPLALLPLRPSSPGLASSSPSASDSDEELPLGRLADRLRGPRRVTASAPPVAATDASRLQTFCVSLHSGEATILLRAEHAPSHPAAPPSPPRLVHARAATAELRRFRIRRKASPPLELAPRANGFGNTFGLRLRRLLEEGGPPLTNASRSPLQVKLELDREVTLEAEPHSVSKQEPKFEVKLEPKEDADEDSTGSLAAAIIARAVLLCRASLYPGLHTIIAPPVPAIEEPTASVVVCPEPECGWCLQQFGARRCLWYGPARETTLAARAWRRVRARRYLCACCGTDEVEPARVPDEPSGWYGKGYRKGRRRRR